MWRKVHLAIDEATLEVLAVEITDSTVGDVPMLADLLSQIPAYEPVSSVTADGAYDGRACRGTIATRGAEARAVIEALCIHYNTVRPHSSLGYSLPAPEAIYGPSKTDVRRPPKP